MVTRAMALSSPQVSRCGLLVGSSAQHQKALHGTHCCINNLHGQRLAPAVAGDGSVFSMCYSCIEKEFSRWGPAGQNTSAFLHAFLSLADHSLNPPCMQCR